MSVMRDGRGKAEPGAAAIPWARAPYDPDQAYRASAQRVRRGFGAGLSLSGYGRAPFREARTSGWIDPDIFFGPAKNLMSPAPPTGKSPFRSQTGPAADTK